MADYSIPRITGAELGAAKDIIERAAAGHGLSAGHPVVVSLSSGVYLYSCEGGAEPADSSYPNCPLEVCAEFREQIREICRSMYFPPSQPILIYHNDELCLCYCR